MVLQRKRSPSSILNKLSSAILSRAVFDSIIQLPVKEISPLARFSLLSVDSLARRMGDEKIDESPSLHGYCTLRSKTVLPFTHTEPMHGEDPNLESKFAPRGGFRTKRWGNPVAILWI